MKRDTEGLITLLIYAALYVFLVVAVCVKSVTLISIAFLLIIPFPVYTIIRFLSSYEKSSFSQKMEIAITFTFIVFILSGIAFIPNFDNKDSFIQILSAFIAKNKCFQ